MRRRRQYLITFSQHGSKIFKTATIHQRTVVFKGVRAGDGAALRGQATAAVLSIRGFGTKTKMAAEGAREEVETQPRIMIIAVAAAAAMPAATVALFMAG